MTMSGGGKKVPIEVRQKKHSRGKCCRKRGEGGKKHAVESSVKNEPCIWHGGGKGGGGKKEGTSVT